MAPSRVCSFRCPEELFQALEATGRPFSTQVVEALEAYVLHIPGQPPQVLEQMGLDAVVTALQGRFEARLHDRPDMLEAWQQSWVKQVLKNMGSREDPEQVYKKLLANYRQKVGLAEAQ